MVSQQISSAQSASTQKLSSAPFLLILVAYNVPSFYDMGFTIVFSNKYHFLCRCIHFPMWESNKHLHDIGGSLQK